MKAELHTEWTVADICDGFVYDELEAKGLFGMGGRLTIQPEYQRNYIYADPYVKNRKGVYEYLHGGETDTKLLDIRVFDEATKKAVYARQTAEAKEKGASNCPYCAIGNDANASRIWKLSEMDADHVTAWSRGGATDISNCRMLCKHHNRAKGNR